MIFVTIGSMLPFDRLVKSMDSWALRHPDEKIFAQIGDGAYVPKHMLHARMLAPVKFRQIYEEASLIVAHAGMGSVISAAAIGKSIVLLPRLAAWKEHTTDHQLHTAGWLRGRPGIFVADSDQDLAEQIEKARLPAEAHERLLATAPVEFVSRIHHALMG